MYLRHFKALAKREMFDDQTSSNIVWWSNILQFGQLVWWCLMVFDDVWSCLNSIKHSIKQHQTFLLFSCLFGDVWFVWPGVSNMFGSQIPPCWNCCGTLGNFVAHNSLCSDVWRCLIKHLWTVWPGLANIRMFDHQTMFDYVCSSNIPVWPGLNVVKILGLLCYKT